VAQYSCKILSQFEAVLKLQLGCLKSRYITVLTESYSNVRGVQIA
jgi:hypothetical protein